MAWENIEERLKKAFRAKVAFPTGSIWLPDPHLDVDEWLTSIAQSDEELRELNIPRMRFLQNRWPVEKLLELEWTGKSPRRSTVSAMYVGRRAYILFSGGVHFQLIAAIEPGNRPALYQAVISKLLTNPLLVPATPAKIQNHHPDLFPDLFVETLGERAESGTGNLQPQAVSREGKARPKHGYLYDLLVGWVGAWIDLPVLGYWHEDAPPSITTAGKGKLMVMEYKAPSASKQKNAQAGQTSTVKKRSARASRE